MGGKLRSSSGMGNLRFMCTLMQIGITKQKKGRCYEINSICIICAELSVLLEVFIHFINIMHNVDGIHSLVRHINIVQANTDA